MGDRIIDPVRNLDETPAETSLRPRSLDEYIGQEELKRNLRVFIEAAKGRSDALDHVLFHGSPGLGKTSLAHIIAHELEVNVNSTSGPVIERAGDLAAILTNLEPGQVLFIDDRLGLLHLIGIDIADHPDLDVLEVEIPAEVPADAVPASTDKPHIDAETRWGGPEHGGRSERGQGGGDGRGAEKAATGDGFHG